MAQYTPQQNLFNTIEKLRVTRNWVFWAILILSITPVISKELCEEKYKFFCDINKGLDFINLLNIIGILAYFTIEIIIEYILLPLAESKRRDDFIDNSFGSIISINSSVDYYDNDEVSIGLYKTAVNLFENCFFTHSLANKMTAEKISIASFVFIIISIFAYYGFKDVPIALTFLQTIFSANILGGIIKHLILINSLSKIHDSWIMLFHTENLKKNISKYETRIYRYWLQYETLHSKINPNIPSSLFKKHNPTLTDEWKKIKSRYNIS
ncbi:MAG: hypothetical protein MUC49_22140 [Raineya sp.]|jgi:hypothetical protein|nr:hypothetical protein [Raineya sp.]